MEHTSIEGHPQDHARGREEDPGEQAGEGEEMILDYGRPERRNVRGVVLVAIAIALIAVYMYQRG